jgi:glyoxylase-like metal-dependent hydrolase (beta-lactamase superfamily II)
VNTGVLVSGERALLFDCCDSVTPEALARLGVRHVDWVLCTQHRRPNVAGAYPFVEAGARLAAPASERHLFEDVDAYWGEWRNRWHLYHQQPSSQVLARPLPVARAVSGGDMIEWEGFTVRVLDTPGATDGSVSYLVTADGLTAAFSGDALYGPGQVWDLYSLQKGFGVISDYHGFLGNRPRLVASLRRLAEAHPDVLVPAHGPIIRDPTAAVELTIERLEEVWRNYTSVSALNFYFPHLLDDTRDDPARMAPAPTVDLPPFVRRVAFTSFALVSQTGAALLVDCGHDSVVETLQGWLAQGTITSVGACWVSHYHDDHVDALPRLVQRLGCPILADRRLAEVLEHPDRFFLPCISPNSAPVQTLEDGQSWNWHEFRLTALYFPGQTLYHGALLAEGQGTRLLFVGDSLAPTGLDDYCAGNRNFLRRGQGLRRCLDLVRRYRPEYLINQHQERAFRFDDRCLDYLEDTLARRETLLAELLPWPHPDFGTDEWWARAYPFQQEVAPGSSFAVDVAFTNHGPEAAWARAEPVLPPGWQWQRSRSSSEVEVGPETSGVALPAVGAPDGTIRLWLSVPVDARPGRYVVPLRITWAGRHLGQIRHYLVYVR